MNGLIHAVYYVKCGWVKACVNENEYENEKGYENEKEYEKEYEQVDVLIWRCVVESGAAHRNFTANIPSLARILRNYASDSGQ